MPQVENLSQIKQQIVLLDEDAKRDLANFLAEELNGKISARDDAEFSDAERRRQLEWIKANREKFAGKYIALSADKLVGEGATRREAKEKAIENGCRNPFLTFVYSENDIPFGGW